MLTGILFTLFLVLLNGFFVAAEFALVKVRGSQIDILAKAGSKQALLSKELLKHLDSYLSATQLGITLASLALGWVGEGVVAEIIIKGVHLVNESISDTMAHTIAVPIAFSIITVLHIVFGELAPKSLAIQKSEQVTLLVSYPLRYFYLLFKPAIWVLNGISNWVLRKFGVEAIHAEGSHSHEELKLLVEQSADESDSDYKIISKAFSFSDKTAYQIMVPRTKISAVKDTITKSELLDWAIVEGYSRIPVYKESLDNITGIIYLKDLVKVINTSAKDIGHLIKPVTYISGHQKVESVLKKFQSEKIHMAIIVDEWGGTDGLITLEDIMEELVGEIQDEWDNEIPLIEQTGPSIWKALGNITMSDLLNNLPEELHPLFENSDELDYETLSGLVTYHKGELPKLHETITLHNCEFKILKLTKTNIDVIQISILENSI
jgi:CBS domain containing-hemolysin-like protein